jgi:hypothetical protein
MSRLTHIYALTDPRNGEIRYIGKANNPSARILQHLEDKGTNYKKEEWIDELLANGMLPEIITLETTDLDHWKEREIYWIEYGRRQGWNLTNLSGGGTGMSQITNPSFANVMRKFLSPFLFNKYKKMNEVKQKEIAQKAAIEYRKRPESPVGVYTREQFQSVSNIVSRLVEESQQRGAS